MERLRYEEASEQFQPGRFQEHHSHYDAEQHQRDDGQLHPFERRVTTGGDQCQCTYENYYPPKQISAAAQ